MKTFKLHLIRHGMTAGNLQGLYIGSGTDIPLCDEGRAQLNELKERFEYPQVDTVFSSPLLRAVETANILFPDAKHTFTVPTRHPEQWMADPGCGYTVQTDVQLWMRDRLVEAIDIVPFGYADTLRGQAETEENEAFE